MTTVVQNFIQILKSEGEEYEIKLKPFTAIMCNYYEGKDDFFRALEFVLGVELTDLRVENPLDLVHKTLQEEFLVNHSIRSYVEVTVNMVQEKKQQKFRKSIKNGKTSLRFEHKISDVITSKVLYEEKLTSLSLNLKGKNLIFYKSYFNNAIWGCSEDLERTINTCLRNDNLLEEWKKARKEVECLSELKRRTSEKHFNSLKTSHLIVAKYTDQFEKIYARRETIREKLLKDFKETSFEESPFETLTSEEEMETEDVDPEIERLDKFAKIEELEAKIGVLVSKLHELKLEESILTCHLYHEEIKLGDDRNVLQKRIKGLKDQLREKEKLLSAVWERITGLKSEVEDLTQKISFNLISVDEIQTKNYLQNRLTPYGRFFEYLQPSRYMNLLKQIIGDEVYYSNLCDTLENGFYCMSLMKMLRYEHRETFIVFQNHSHKLKDLLIASGEKGIQINTLEQLLIFLCKLKHFEVIDEVPIIIQKNFNYDEEMPVFNDYIVYEKSGLHFMKEGVISLKLDENSFCVETLEELQKHLVCLKADEDLKYQKLDDLLISRWELRTQMHYLEDDISYLKRKLKRPSINPQTAYESFQLSDIYRDYSDFFAESFEEWNKYERELHQPEDQFSRSREERSLISDAAIRETKQISNDLDEVCVEKIKTQQELESLNEGLRSLYTIPLYDFHLQRNFKKFNCHSKNSKLFFEIEFNKLKKLMADDDLEDFLGCQEWRRNFITSLVKDFIDIKNKLKNSKEILQTLSTARTNKLFPLLEHCDHHLNSTFNHLMDDALPLIKLQFSSGEETLHLMSSLAEDKINTVDIKHFNTFLKFISVLTVFLEVAVFEKIPIMILDDLEEFFPSHEDNLEAVLNSDVIEKIIPENQSARFHLLMRVGQYLSHYIKKNTPGNRVRNNGNYTGAITGPMQIIYFAKEDFIHAAEHHIWIHSQILPDEYISEDCNSYSEIHEINFNKLVSLS